MTGDGREIPSMENNGGWERESPVFIIQPSHICLSLKKRGKREREGDEKHKEIEERERMRERVNAPFF